MLQRIYKFFHRKSQKGQGIVEYALILAFVVAIAAVALSSNSGIGLSIKNLFTNTGTKIENAGNTVGGNTQSGGGEQSTAGGGEQH